MTSGGERIGRGTRKWEIILRTAATAADRRRLSRARTITQDKI